MGHTTTKLTESELKDYLREHVGVNPSFEGALLDKVAESIQPKRRGRPKGSKNRPKP